MSIYLGNGGSGGGGGGGGGGGINNSNVYILNGQQQPQPKKTFCSLLEKNALKMDHVYLTDISRSSNDFRVTVQGRVHNTPERFNINILPGTDTSQVAFHASFRFSAGKTVFNTRTSSGGWAKEEFAYFSTLISGQKFTAVITSQGSSFEIKINNEAPCYFNHRIPFRDAKRGVFLAGHMTPALIKIEYFE